MKVFKFFTLATLATLLSCTPSIKKLLTKPIATSDTLTLNVFEVEPTEKVAVPQRSSALIMWAATSDKQKYQRIDISVTKKGFSNNLFASLLPVNTKQIFSRPIGQVSAKSLDENIDSIRLENINFRRELNSTIELTGLVPGMNYYIRICHFNKNMDQWIPGKTIKYTAPIRPMDFIKQNQ